MFVLLKHYNLDEYRNKGKGKKGSKQSTVKQLMEKTRGRRQQWIRSDHPLVSEVITKFPHLASSRWVSIMYTFITKAWYQFLQIRREFKAIVSFEEDPASLMDGWVEIQEKIVELSKIESSTRPYLKRVLEGLKKCEELPYSCGEQAYNYIIVFKFLIF